MASCDYCGETILFGGVKDGGLRFCDWKCQSKGQLLSAAAGVPESAATNLARQIHRGPCPRCQGLGPVDVHTAYWVWSALAITRWGTRQQVSCRRCAVKTQAGKLALSAAIGWWGFPWGFFVTPVQVFRNVLAIASPPNPTEPSAKLIRIARARLASQMKDPGKQGSTPDPGEGLS
jgi:hypothetical protein